MYTKSEWDKDNSTPFLQATSSIITINKTNLSLHTIITSKRIPKKIPKERALFLWLFCLSLPLSLILNRFPYSPWPSILLVSASHTQKTTPNKENPINQNLQKPALMSITKQWTREEEEAGSVKQKTINHTDTDLKVSNKRPTNKYLLGTLLLSNFISLLTHVSQPCPRTHQLPTHTTPKQRLNNNNNNNTPTISQQNLNQRKPNQNSTQTNKSQTTKSHYI